MPTVAAAPHPAEGQRLDRVFAALADPTRRAILDRLARGPSSISELAEPFTMSLPAVLKHLQILAAAGLVDRDKQGRTVHCRLDPAPIREARTWLADRVAFWTTSLDRLPAVVG